MLQFKPILVYTERNRNNSAMRHVQLAILNGSRCGKVCRKPLLLFSRKVTLPSPNRTPAPIFHSLKRNPALRVPALRVKPCVCRLMTKPGARTGIHGFPAENPTGQFLQGVTCSLQAIMPEGFVFPIQIK